MVDPRNIILSMALVLGLLHACGAPPERDTDQRTWTNAAAKRCHFLVDLENDDHCLKHLVRKGQGILVERCHGLERERPTTLDDLYTLSHRSTEAFNPVQAGFELNDSEIEAAARGSIGADFAFIAKANGFEAEV